MLDPYWPSSWGNSHDLNATNTWNSSRQNECLFVVHFGQGHSNAFGLNCTMVVKTNIAKLTLNLNRTYSYQSVPGQLLEIRCLRGVKTDVDIWCSDDVRKKPLTTLDQKFWISRKNQWNRNISNDLWLWNSSISCFVVSSFSNFTKLWFLYVTFGAISWKIDNFAGGGKYLYFEVDHPC